MAFTGSTLRRVEGMAPGNLAPPGDSGLDLGPLFLFHKSLKGCLRKYYLVVVNMSLGDGQDFK